jgi:hypothetical protein
MLPVGTATDAAGAIVERYGAATGLVATPYDVRAVDGAGRVDR